MVTMGDPASKNSVYVRAYIRTYVPVDSSRIFLFAFDTPRILIGAGLVLDFWNL